MAARVGTRSAFICPVSDQCCVHEASILRVGTDLCCAGDELSAVSFMAARECLPQRAQNVRNALRLFMAATRRLSACPMPRVSAVSNQESVTARKEG